MSAPLRIGLQEWAVCARALTEGRSVLIVRKGGIHEPRGGLFRPEHERFALLPTFLHQGEERLRTAFGGAYFAESAKPSANATIPVSAWAAVAQVWRLEDTRGLESLGDDIPWSPAELEARLAYRGQRWMFALALRVQVLERAISLPDRPSYAGCRSWIPLEDAVPVEPARPALDDARWAERLGRVRLALGAGAPAP
jgi:hypothetical protein